MSTSQQKFGKQRSTVTQLLSFFDEVYYTSNFNVPSAAVCFDFSNAFDSVRHDIILNKLSMYGFDHGFLLFFSSYLGNPSQCFTFFCSLTIQSCFLLILRLYSMILILLQTDVHQMIHRSITISAVSLFLRTVFLVMLWLSGKPLLPQM